jgi:hypothetical protein
MGETQTKGGESDCHSCGVILAMAQLGSKDDTEEDEDENQIKEAYRC